MLNTVNAVKVVAEKINLATKAGDLCGYLIQNPLSLAEEIKEKIFLTFYPVARRAFEQEDSDLFKKDVRKHLFEVDGLIVVFDEIGNGLAFRTFSAIGANAVYLEGVAIDPNRQKIGLYRPLIQSVARNFAITATRTQSPVVITALKNVFGSVAPITRDADCEEREVAATLAKRLGMTDRFNSETLVGKSVYGCSLYKTPPQGDQQITNILYELINIWEGDCIIAVCRWQ